MELRFKWSLTDFKAHVFYIILCCLHCSLYHRLTYNELFMCQSSLVGYEILDGKGPILCRLESSCPSTVSKMKYIQHYSSGINNVKKFIKCLFLHIISSHVTLRPQKKVPGFQAQQSNWDQNCPPIITIRKLDKIYKIIIGTHWTKVSVGLWSLRKGKWIRLSPQITPMSVWKHFLECNAQW